MHRYTFIILFFVVLVAPFVVRQVVARKSDVAAPTGKVRELTVVTPHNQDIRRTFAAAFSDWHQKNFGSSVRVTYLTPGGTNDIVRLLNDKYDVQRDTGKSDGKLPPEEKTRADIDMMWGGGDFPFDVELKPRGVLKPVTLTPEVMAAAFPSPDIAGVPLFESASKDRPGAAPRWVGVALSGFGMIYSPPIFKTLGLPVPTKWEDLADPKLAGLIAGTDPMRSASVASAYMNVVQRAMTDAEEQAFASNAEMKSLAKADRLLINKEGKPIDGDYQRAIGVGWKKGMGTLLLMAANSRYFTDSGSQPCNDVAQGEAAGGVAIDFFARVNEEVMGQDRIRYLAPKSASAINADPIAILYGVRGEREETANRFITFLLTPEAQKLWNLKGGTSEYVPRSLRRLPIVQSVYADRSGWTDNVNPFEESGGFNARQEWTGPLFSDMRPVWTCSWIDSRSELKRAYDAILNVSDKTRQAGLLVELADGPITMQDVLNQRAMRKLVDSGKHPTEKDARVWGARQRLEWAEKFREHYRAVEAKARGS